MTAKTRGRGVIGRALEQHRLWRDVCARGARCVITATSRREPIVMGGKTYAGVFCNTCGVGREDKRESKR